MPIIYDPIAKGWKLKDPTKEEIEALEVIAIDQITTILGKMAAVAYMRQQEQAKGDEATEDGTEDKTKITFN